MPSNSKSSIPALAAGSPVPLYHQLYLQLKRQIIAEQVWRVDRRKDIRVQEQLLAAEEAQVVLERLWIGRLKACPAQK